MNSMRERSLIIVVLLLFVWQGTQAQVRLEVPEMYVGVSAGATASMVTFSPTVEHTFQLGMNGGAAFRYIGDRNVGFQLEMNFMQLGWDEKEVEHDRMLNYIEVPFMTHVYFGHKVRGFFNVGPKVSVLVSENSSAIPSPSEPQHEKVDNRFDYGLCAGLGMIVNTQRAGCYQLEARFAYSLGHVFDNSKKDYFASSNFMGLSLNLGWFFPLMNK